MSLIYEKQKKTAGIGKSSHKHPRNPYRAHSGLDFDLFLISERFQISARRRPINGRSNKQKLREFIERAKARLSSLKSLQAGFGS